MLSHDCCIKWLNLKPTEHQSFEIENSQPRLRNARQHSPMELQHMEIRSDIHHLGLDVPRGLVQHQFRVLCSDSVWSRASSKSVCLHELLEHACCMQHMILELTEHQLFEVEPG